MTGGPPATMATVGRHESHGRPHSVPVWFVWDAGTLWFLTSRHSQKGVDLAHQPAVVLSPGDGDDVVVLVGPRARGP